ncbi:hypothetical protein ACNOYE_20235 [Nannocystaceae bacterium ST9]
MTESMKIMISLALLASGCNWEPCGVESADFELREPGDAIEIRIEACPEGGQGDMTIDMDLTGSGTPTSAFAVIVDGVQVSAVGPMSWVTSSGFSEAIADSDCSPGRVITLRRIDEQPELSFSGSVSVDMSAPAQRTCSVDVSVSPL